MCMYGRQSGLSKYWTTLEIITNVSAPSSEIPRFGNQDLHRLVSTDSEEDRKFYRNNPDKLLAHIKQLEDEMNKSFDMNILGSPEQKALAAATEKRMRDMIKDEKLLEGPFCFLRPFPRCFYLQGIY